MKQKLVRLPDAELEVMKAVWSARPPVSTAETREILERIRPWNLSALQTLLGRLVERGFLSTGKEGRNRVYTPCLGRDEYLAFENKNFLDKVNDGSVTMLVASLCQSNAISEQDFAELAAFIRDKAGEGGTNG